MHILNKIIKPDNIVSKIQALKKNGKKIVFTNGCFDILHAGHVKYLTRAASLGDVLILGLNSDFSVKKIKGEKRPISGQEHRSLVVAALACIDHVVLFDESDPLILIETICPAVLVKGADWHEDQIIGADFVKNNGGRVERVALEPDISTTKIIEKIGNLYYGKQ